MINIFIAPMRADSASYYRGIGPFSHLRRMHSDELNIVDGNDLQEITWATLAKFDIIFIFRPQLSIHHKIATMANDLGIPLWVDIDDDMLNVPLEHPRYEFFQDATFKETHIAILDAAEIITVTVRKLADIYGKRYENKVNIIPNAIDEKMLRPLDKLPKLDPKQKVITWRGSDTHNMNLLEFSDEISNAIGNTRDIIWEFFGWNPYYITADVKDKKKLLIRQDVDVMEYFADIQFKRRMAFHVPLADNIFNRCRSNIAWLEATISGSVCVAPMWEQWMKPGVINYVDNVGYYSALDQIYKNQIKAEAHLEESIKHIKSNYTLQIVNPIRWQIIQELLRQ